MKLYKSIIISIVFILLLASCGVSGDPGHCYISIDWEYYNEDYRVYYYDDNNPEVPELDLIDAGYYYDSYPGIYEYSYESEDEHNWYSYTGTYTLIQNLGFQGGLFHDGLDGADTYFDLFLYIRARKGLAVDEPISIVDENANFKKFAANEQLITSNPSNVIQADRTINSFPIREDSRSWEQTKGNWTIIVNEEVRMFGK
jgi:hypothetical protein